MKPLLLSLSLLFASPSSFGAQHTMHEPLFSPDKGVLCDRQAGFCVDSYGISMGFTKEFLGQQAQDNMMELINRVGSNNFDTTRYSFSNKVYCDSEQKACFVDRFSEEQLADYTSILFD
ncbi:YcgJ family protein [Photobacterium sp. DNB23_23_1]|uniref:YcgJ family protein n=1 Tax=Photobacterium pectinilyticum TaxID=2906793 RepID=A0ABT1MZ80_9GAMM|nr:YcgJ family protein [Photobacterium sp. ZSDE20]MCQ1057790.1 YcgJ family protein [Photobacterium sp. ZSDE20]MDD1822298.1 YcgJ family protein [Photobacterium sp. ZSDE20]